MKEWKQGTVMTDEVRRHYETILAPNYTWMFGLSLAAKVAEQKALLIELLDGLMPAAGAALDLGSGPGFQALALAELGFSPVLALDTSAGLLAELEANRGDHKVVAICADLRDVARHAPAEGVRIAVCMGDTLTHLPDRDTVERLFADVFRLLLPGGVFVLTFRDLSQEMTGVDRFIPVRSDADRIMTCFLEFAAETVTVHDLIHHREPGGWVLHKSSYKKLRLAPAWVAAGLARAGFEVSVDRSAGRLHALVARR